jgi:hypothetical protein
MCQQLKQNCECVNSLDAIIYNRQGVASFILHVIAFATLRQTQLKNFLSCY